MTLSSPHVNELRDPFLLTPTPSATQFIATQLTCACTFLICSLSDLHHDVILKWMFCYITFYTYLILIIDLPFIFIPCKSPFGHSSGTLFGTVSSYAIGALYFLSACHQQKRGETLYHYKLTGWLGEGVCFHFASKLH